MEAKLPWCILILTVAITSALELTDIEATCQVHANTVVDVDPGRHRYFPYMVKLPRCVGTVGIERPDVQTCVAKSSVSVSYSVLEVVSYAHTSIDLVSHTECQHSCVASPSSCNPKYQTWNSARCLCDCKFRKAPNPSPCEYPKVWQSASCKCVCPRAQTKCSDKKEWSDDDCGCTCKKRYLNRCAKKGKVVSQESCSCIAPIGVNGTLAARGAQGTCNGVESKFVVMIVIIEFLCLVFIFFLIYRYSPRREPSSRPTFLPKSFTFKKKNKSPGKDNRNVEYISEEQKVTTPLSNGNNLTENEDSAHGLKELSLRDSNEAPVGFYYATSDVFGSTGNVSMESSGKVSHV